MSGPAGNEAARSFVDPSREPRSAFIEALGLRVTDWREGFARLEAPVQEWYLNRSGVLQGGIASALIDMACGFAGLYAPPGEPDKRAVTLSLTVHFTGQVHAGHLIAEGRLRDGGRRVFFSEATLWGVAAPGDDPAGGEMVAFGTATFRRRSGS